MKKHFFCLILVVCALIVSSVSPGEAAGEKVPVELTLEEAVKIALERNLGMRLKKLDADQAASAVVAEKSVFDMNLEASADTGESRGEINNLTLSKSGILSPAGISKDQTTNWMIGVGKTYEAGTQLSLTWNNERKDTNASLLANDPAYRSFLEAGVTQPLLKGFGVDIQTAGVQAAEQRYEAADLLTQQEAIQLAANVKSAYWELVFAIELNEVLKLSLTRAKALLDETQGKIKAGTLAPVDIYEAEAEVARREQQLIAGNRNIASAADALKSLLNVEDWTSSITPVTPVSPVVQSPEYQATLDQALGQRPDLKAVERSVSAAKLLLNRAKNSRLPSLDLTAAAGLNGLGDNYGDAMERYGEDHVYSWRVGFVFSVPFPNNAAAAAEASALADEERALTQKDQLVQDINRSVREAVRNVDVAAQIISATAKTSLAQQKRLEAEEAKFKVGLSTSNLVLQAQEAYILALSVEKRARVDYEKAKAELDRTKGLISGGKS